MNAVIYARYSSERQTEQSIEGQIRVCNEYAEKHDLQIVNTYIDRAMSGTSAEHRTNFQRMIQDSASGKFQAVLVYKLDRFARNRYDSAIYKAKLKKNGVKVVSATEQISDTPEGIIMEAVLEGMDEYYSAELSRKSKRGIREGIIKGHNCGKELFGYRRENKRYVLDGTTAPAVKAAFEMYASGGYTMVAIAETLNSQGYRSVNGNLFKRWGIYDMLHNDKYTGEHYIDGIPEAEKCPQIVSKELFEKVQERLQKSAKQARKSRTGHIYALTGLLQCGYCGGAICGTSTKDENRHYFYYQHRNRECAHRCNFSADKLEETVLNALQDYLTQDKMDVIAERTYRLYKEQDHTPDSKAMLQEIDRKIKNIVHAIETGTQSKALSQKLAELERQREELENQPIQQPRLKLEHFRLFLERLAFTIETEKDRRAVFAALVNSVTVFDDYIVVAVNVTDEKNPPKLEEIRRCLDSVGNPSLYPTQYKIIFTPLSLLLFIKK